MPKPHKPGPRLVLRADVWEWLAARDRRYQQGPDARPNYQQIAYASHCSPSYLSRIRSGELPLTLEFVAGLVKASGLADTPHGRMQSLTHILDWIDEEDRAWPLAAELAGAAA